MSSRLAASWYSHVCGPQPLLRLVSMTSGIWQNRRYFSLRLGYKKYHSFHFSARLLVLSPLLLPQPPITHFGGNQLSSSHTKRSMWWGIEASSRQRRDWAWKPILHLHMCLKSLQCCLIQWPKTHERPWACWTTKLGPTRFLAYRICEIGNVCCYKSQTVFRDNLLHGTNIV